MLNLALVLRWPQSCRFVTLKSWHGSTPFANKHWEAEILKTTDIVSVEFSVSLRSQVDHAGIRVGLGLLGYNFGFSFYDLRHKHVEADKAHPAMWQVKFSIMDIETGNYIVARTELCYSIFEAEQLVADDGARYDKAVIIPRGDA